MKQTLALLIAMLLVPSFAFARSPMKLPVPKPLNLKASISHPYIPVGKAQTVFASLTIQANDFKNGTRAPLNLGLVIDRSTSMSGDKFVKAIEASVTLVEMLSPSDRISIVSYGSDVSIEHAGALATPANKELLVNAVRNIRLSGSTNLSGGYETARGLVLRNASDKTIDRVVLLSDGHANVGVTNQMELAALARNGLNNGVSLTTIGLGLDYNEDIMTAMAKGGAGNYHFVENGNAIAKIFGGEFQGLSSTVAKNTVVTIETAPGIELLEVKGFPVRTKGQTSTIKLAEFFGSQQKDLLLKFSANATAQGKLPLATVKLRYDDMTANSKRTYASKKLRATASTKLSDHKKVNRGVLKRAQQVATAESFDRAMEQYEDGKADEAAKTVAAQRASNSSFVKQYDFADDASFGRVDKELKAVEKNVRAAKPSSKSGKRLRKKQKARSYNIAQEASVF